MRNAGYKYFISTILTSLFFAYTASAFAPCAVDHYELIAPFGSLPMCVDLQGYMQGIFTSAIGIAGILAVIMIVWCGIKLMTAGSVSGKNEAKECITNAIFGVLIAIGSWLLLNTINPLLLKKTPPELAQITTSTPAPTPSGPRVDPFPLTPGWYFRYIDKQGNTKNSARFDTSQYCDAVQKQATKDSTTITNGPNGTPGCFEIRATPQPAGEAATRIAICGNDLCKSSNTGVYVNKNSCVPPNANGVKNGCTNVDGLPSYTISFLKNLHNACNCTITITGGTENGHSSHGQSIPVFDLSRISTLNDFILNNSTLKHIPSFGAKLPSGQSVRFYKWYYGGYWFTDETGGSHDPHWHVCKQGTAAPTADRAGLFQRACNQ